EGAMGWEAQRTPPPSVFLGNQGLLARRPRVIEAGAWEVKERPAPADRMQVGQRVFHQKFGYGRVTAVEDDRLDIEFEKSGTKRVLDRFVERA
ncbi:MAG TPA: DNA helicase II, partial [Acetobacteraceae bacterium]|nr:DNA helicase II [Acetobacteraceae bacterium]